MREGMTETSAMEPMEPTAPEPPIPVPPRPTPAPDGGAGAEQTPTFVFALGRVAPRFPSLGVEKEFAQAIGRGDTDGLTDRQALHRILSDRSNRYLARQLCWCFEIEGLSTYILTPRDPGDFDLLIEAVRRDPNPNDLDAVIGMLGPIAPPEACNGLMVPLVAFDQLYSFDRDSLLASIPRPENADEEQFHATAGELIDRIMQLADNAGATDEHRVLNYLAVRYDAVYAQTAEMHARDFSLTAVDVRPSRLSGARRIFDAIFSYTNRRTDVAERYFCRVDASERFLHLVTKLSPYYER